MFASDVDAYYTRLLSLSTGYYVENVINNDKLIPHHNSNSSCIKTRTHTHTFKLFRLKLLNAYYSFCVCAN